MINYCPECGSKVEKETRFCPNCGYELNEKELPPINPSNTISPPIQYSAPPVAPQYYKHSDNTKGIIALVFGILGFVFLPFIGSIVAIILGAIARSQEEDSSLGTIGLMLGILGLVCWIIFMVFIFGWIFSMMNPYYYY